jgi:hypothetical protein
MIVLIILSCFIVAFLVGWFIGGILFDRDDSNLE